MHLSDKRTPAAKGKAAAKGQASLKAETPAVPFASHNTSAGHVTKPSTPNSKMPKSRGYLAAQMKTWELPIKAEEVENVKKARHAEKDVLAMEGGQVGSAVLAGGAGEIGKGGQAGVSVQARQADHEATQGVADTLGLPPSETYLHRLPAELRNRIYRLDGLHNARLELGKMKEPALTVAIPDLRNELHSIIFAENKFEVDVFSHYKQHDSAQIFSRVEPRGGKFGVGKLALEPGSWVLQADPQVVAIDHIGFDVREMDGTFIYKFFVNVRVDAKTGNRVLRTLTYFNGRNPQKKKGVEPMTNLARARTKKLAEAAGFVGFSWENVKQIAAAFESVESAKMKIRKKYGIVSLVDADW